MAMMGERDIRHNLAVIDAVNEDGWSVVRAAVGPARERLGDRLLSTYVIGSLAHGGFAPAVSDVDVALLTSDLEADMTEIVADVTAEVARTNSFGDRLSIFHTPWSEFADPPSGARFPPIDRFDLLRYGIFVDGSDLRATFASAPRVEEIRTHAVDSALRRVTTTQLAQDLDRLRRNGVTVRDATKIVLWPVRFQHVCDVGEATGNADAVDHYLELPGAAHRALVQDALSWRDLNVLPDPDEARRRITHEIRRLHAEVLERVGANADMPRHHELLARARQLSSTA